MVFRVHFGMLDATRVRASSMHAQVVALHGLGLFQHCSVHKSSSPLMIALSALSQVSEDDEQHGVPADVWSCLDVHPRGGAHSSGATSPPAAIGPEVWRLYGGVWAFMDVLHRAVEGLASLSPAGRPSTPRHATPQHAALASAPPSGGAACQAANLSL